MGIINRTNARYYTRYLVRYVYGNRCLSRPRNRIYLVYLKDNGGKVIVRHSRCQL